MPPKRKRQRTEEKEGDGKQQQQKKAQDAEGDWRRPFITDVSKIPKWFPRPMRTSEGATAMCVLAASALCYSSFEHDPRDGGVERLENPLPPLIAAIAGLTRTLFGRSSALRNNKERDSHTTASEVPSSLPPSKGLIPMVMNKTFLRPAQTDDFQDHQCVVCTVALRNECLPVLAAQRVTMQDDEQPLLACFLHFHCAAKRFDFTTDPSRYIYRFEEEMHPKHREFIMQRALDDNDDDGGADRVLNEKKNPCKVLILRKGKSTLFPHIIAPSVSSSIVAPQLGILGCVVEDSSADNFPRRAGLRRFLCPTEEIAAVVFDWLGVPQDDEDDDWLVVELVPQWAPMPSLLDVPQPLRNVFGGLGYNSPPAYAFVIATLSLIPYLTDDEADTALLLGKSDELSSGTYFGDSGPKALGLRLSIEVRNFHDKEHVNVSQYAWRAGGVSTPGVPYYNFYGPSRVTEVWEALHTHAGSRAIANEKGNFEPSSGQFHPLPTKICSPAEAAAFPKTVTTRLVSGNIFPYGFDVLRRPLTTREKTLVASEFCFEQWMTPSDFAHVGTKDIDELLTLYGGTKRGSKSDRIKKIKDLARVEPLGTVATRKWIYERVSKGLFTSVDVSDLPWDAEGVIDETQRGADGKIWFGLKRARRDPDIHRKAPTDKQYRAGEQ